LHGATRSEVNAFTELSERELEVLRLIADGVSNSDIAAQLVISEKTVKSHVSNILSKLHVLDRTQAAVYAWREGVMRRGESLPYRPLKPAAAEIGPWARTTPTTAIQIVSDEARRHVATRGPA